MTTSFIKNDKIFLAWNINKSKSFD